VARRQRAVDPQLIFRGPAKPGGPIFDPGERFARTPTGLQATLRRRLSGDIIMGKYLVGWLLGVPVFVLVILYFFFH
jgi:hypothetical protein